MKAQSSKLYNLRVYSKKKNKSAAKGQFKRKSKFGNRCQIQEKGSGDDFDKFSSKLSRKYKGKEKEHEELEIVSYHIEWAGHTQKKKNLHTNGNKYDNVQESGGIRVKNQKSY